LLARSRFWRSLLLLAPVVLAGCTASMIRIIPQPPGGGTTTVVVTAYKKDTIDPLGVEATVIAGGQRVTLPAGDITVSVANVPLGEADPHTQPLTVTASGFVTSFQELELSTVGQTTVTVELEAADLSLTGTMMGTITATGGTAPVSNATVQFRPDVPGGSEYVVEGATDEQGQYVIGGIPTGNVIVTVNAQGYLTDSAQAVVIEDTSPSGNPALDVSLVPTTTKVTVQGRVTDLITGAGVGGATVTIGSLTPVTTRDDGSFEVAEVPVGSQTASVTASDYDPRSVSFTAAPGMSDLAIELAPTSSQPPSGPATIIGMVIVRNRTDNSGVTVKGIRGWSDTGDVLDTKVTGPSGEYGLFVPPGDYRIQVTFEGVTDHKDVTLPGGGRTLTVEPFEIMPPAALRARSLRPRGTTGPVVGRRGGSRR
jgi:hypothetical protein